MRLLCRITIEPDSCVRRTENMFTRYGMWGVMVSKFVPGLSTMAPPLAGMSGSPIYLDGRLAGALAYGWHFAKDAVAGVTPIANMLAEQVSLAIANIELRNQLRSQESIA